MPIVQERRLGVIIDYRPMDRKGVIRDVESGQEFPFRCEHVRTEALRRNLSRTCRFGEHVFLRPNLYVTFEMCGVRGDLAGRIDLFDELPEDRDLGAPLLGYVQFYGQSYRGKDGFAGWINQNLGSSDDGSAWFDSTRVIDPALRAHLWRNRELRRPQWREQAILVRYWKVDEGKATPSTTHIALADDALREKWMAEYGIGADEIRAWEARRGEYLSAPETDVPAYVELPGQKVPMTPRERKTLNDFYQEALKVTASNPAQRGQLDALWDRVGRNCSDALMEALAQLPNINGTRLALVCRAACSYLDRHYGEALALCRNAMRYEFTARLAVSLENYGIAQHMAEMALAEEFTDPRIDLLAEVAIHTGNAQAFCDFFETILEEDDGELEGEAELFLEASMGLLERLGVDAGEMEPEEACREVRARYNAAIPGMDELLQRQREQDAVPCSFVIPPNRLMPPELYKAGEARTSPAPARMPGPAATAAPREAAPASAATIEDFRRRFMTEKGPRTPDPAGDRDALPMLDGILASELPDVGDYRMPLLTRASIDPAGSEAQIRAYLGRLERDLAKRRRKFEKDRRWRLFQALMTVVRAGDEASRAQAFEKVWQEAQDSEKAVLETLRRNGQ